MEGVSGEASRRGGGAGRRDSEEGEAGSSRGASPMGPGPALGRRHALGKCSLSGSNGIVSTESTGHAAWKLPGLLRLPESALYSARLNGVHRMHKGHSLLQQPPPSWTPQAQCPAPQWGSQAGRTRAEKQQWPEILGEEQKEVGTWRWTRRH